MGERDRTTADRAQGQTLTRKLVRMAWVALLLLTTTGCQAQDPRDGMVGVGMTGIDHLDDHLSIQNFWVDGYNGAQAGKGGRTVCCAMLPPTWRPGITVQVRWEIDNWRDKTYSMHEAAVPVEHYEVPGHVWVHFLRDGSVRVISTELDTPLSPTYVGPRDRIPQKHPWDEYPLVPDRPPFQEVPDASQGEVK